MGPTVESCNSTSSSRSSGWVITGPLPSPDASPSGYAVDTAHLTIKPHVGDVLPHAQGPADFGRSPKTAQRLHGGSRPPRCQDSLPKQPRRGGAPPSGPASETRARLRSLNAAAVHRPRRWHVGGRVHPAARSATCWPTGPRRRLRGPIPGLSYSHPRRAVPPTPRDDEGRRQCEGAVGCRYREGVRPPAETTATARTGTVDVGALVSFRAAKP